MLHLIHEVQIITGRNINSFGSDAELSILLSEIFCCTEHDGARFLCCSSVRLAEIAGSAKGQQ